jgi:hypothetical protein
VVTAKSYDEVRHLFWDDYDRRNPITMQKAMDDWVDGDGLPAVAANAGGDVT